MTKKNDINKYALLDYDFTNFAPGALVVDIGCGKGRQLQKLKARGCRTIGVEPNQERVLGCVQQGLHVVTGHAEHLPIENGVCDGVICKGVIPFTEERTAFREIARILKPGGIAHLWYLGSGFYLRLLVMGSGGWLKQRFYGLRTIINTWIFAVSGHVLPGDWGDTVYQSRSRLSRYYLENRFAFRHETPSKTFLGLPVFIYHIVEAPPRMQLERLSEPVAEETAEVLHEVAS